MTVRAIPGPQGRRGHTEFTGPKGEPGTSVLVSIIATQDIPAFVAVTRSGQIADSGSTAHYGKVVGIVATAIGLGFSGSVAESGEVTNPGWSWTPGDVIFVNGPGLASVAPVTGWIQSVGVAKSTTTIIVCLGVPVLV